MTQPGPRQQHLLTVLSASPHGDGAAVQDLREAMRTLGYTARLCDLEHSLSGLVARGLVLRDRSGRYRLSADVFEREGSTE